jgi:hypothetical protein
MMDRVTESAEISPSPPVTFPVFGLNPSWSGWRWLDGFGDRIGDEVGWVRLAHQSAVTGALLMVESHSRALTDARAEHSGEPAVQSLAFAASVVLVNLTLPEQSVPRPPGALRALVRIAEARAAAYADWSPLSWLVDGVEATARGWRFAEGWAAFSETVDGAYLAVAGSAGTDPDRLAFTRLRDGRGYGFDLAAPLAPSVITASSDAAGGHQRPSPLRADWHADQIRAMREYA